MIPDDLDVSFVPVEHFRVMPELHGDLGLRYPVYDLTVDTGDELARPVLLEPSSLQSSDIVVVSFVVVRKLPDPRRPYDNPTVTFKVVLKSALLLNTCREVIGEIPRLSWTAKQVEVSA